MIYLAGKDKKDAVYFFEEAVKAALNSGCLRDKCGSVIVNKDKIIGVGFNSPAGKLESQRRCLEDKTLLHSKITDKLCCVHAEQRAIIHALKDYSKELPGSRLYFIRLDGQGNKTKAGDPYCTICSKMALDVGINEFVLWHSKGICVYNTEEYNSLSYQYKG